MKCGRADCPNDGAWIPTLVLHPRRSLVTARFQVSTVVCGEHKSNNAEVYLSDESWKAFLGWFDERKLERPHRSLSKVDYVPLEPGLHEVELAGSDACDECDGSGTYYLDGKPQQCICTEPQS